MKIGVMSDTHGYLDTMRQAASRMINRHGVDTIIHLGDDSVDVECLNALPVDIYWVPGIYETRYKVQGIDNRVIKEFEGTSFLLTHTPTRVENDTDGDINPTEAIEDGDVKVVLHGHTHEWRIVEEKEVIIINPGHLVPAGHKASKGKEPTYAILDLTPGRLEAKIISLTDEVVAEKTFFFSNF